MAGSDSRIWKIEASLRRSPGTRNPILDLWQFTRNSFTNKRSSGWGLFGCVFEKKKKRVDQGRRWEARKSRLVGSSAFHRETRNRGFTSKMLGQKPHWTGDTGPRKCPINVMDHFYAQFQPEGGASLYEKGRRNVGVNRDWKGLAGGAYPQGEVCAGNDGRLKPREGLIYR